ncbi:MAG: ribose-phosphate diphosphokinase [Pseudomonadales bacterium]|nr:ribose-phosphate diphosphokinase [Pseudomonadales bacterium]
MFALSGHPLLASIGRGLPAQVGELESRHFPDGESYLRIDTAVQGRHCILLADLSRPDAKFLPLVFLASTLRELGAASVGLLAPYLSYMRQDIRFARGEALTSRIFAGLLSQQVDWLLTMDPHLHRYHALDEIYAIPTRVVSGMPALAAWLQTRKHLLLVGPDAESAQWLEKLAACSAHPFVVGEKKRRGDYDVEVSLPDLSCYRDRAAVIVDDVIASGHTLVKCMEALQKEGIDDISCAAVHGIFTGNAALLLQQKGLRQLVTTNTVVHPSNGIDVAELLLPALRECLQTVMAEPE